MRMTPSSRFFTAARMSHPDGGDDDPAVIVVGVIADDLCPAGGGKPRLRRAAGQPFKLFREGGNAVPKTPSRPRHCRKALSTAYCLFPVPIFYESVPPQKREGERFVLPFIIAFSAPHCNYFSKIIAYSAEYREWKRSPARGLRPSGCGRSSSRRCTACKRSCRSSPCRSARRG